VDREFGTGVVKVTPAHDQNDYQVGQRHKLPMICVLTLTAKINDEAPEKYRGMDRFVARKAIVADLEALGLLVEIKKHKLMVPICDRTGQVIEPMLTDQWFVAMSKVGDQDPTASPSPKAIDRGLRRSAVCARELGQHLQPVDEQHPGLVHLAPAVVGPPDSGLVRREGNIYVAKNEAEAQAQAPGKTLTRDPDVLDTWYSSAMVPFSTMGWPGRQCRRR
jgi:valyl-tRNA synthetase